MQLDQKISQSNKSRRLSSLSVILSLLVAILMIYVAHAYRSREQVVSVVNPEIPDEPAYPQQEQPLNHVVIEKDLGDGFGVSEGVLYYNFSKVTGVSPDIATFSSLGNGFFKDAKNVYAYGEYTNPGDQETNSEQVPLVLDAPTFVSVGTCACSERSCGYYFMDKDHVYEGYDATSMTTLTVIDRPSFQYLGFYSNAEGMPYADSYAKDKNNVYTCNGPLANANPNLFTDLKDGYAKDSNTVWYLGDIVKYSDAATFASIGDGYAIDKYQVYFEDNVLAGADRSTFRVVHRGTNDIYGADNMNVYEYGQLQKTLDPALYK